MGPGLKSFLAIYRCFYDHNYKPNFRRNGVMDRNAQNLYYLLSGFKMDINLRNSSCDGYTWLQNSPYSNRLDDHLSSLVVIDKMIETFYLDNDEKKLKGYLRPDVLEKLVLFKSIFFTEEVNKLLMEANRRKKDWIKVLVTMAFIKNKRLINGSFGEINKEIMRNGIWWSSFNNLNKLAWESLVKVGIINV